MIKHIQTTNYNKGEKYMSADYKLVLTPIADLNDEQQLVRENETGKIFILTPIKTNVIKRTQDILMDNEESSSLAIKKNIQLKLISIGIPAHARGFSYLIDILSMIYELDEDKINLCALYKKVAEKRNTYPEGVQKIIKLAIDQCEKTDYYYSIFKTHQNVTNKTFLSGVSSLLKLEIY